MNKSFINISAENPLSRWRERARVRVALIFGTTLIRPFGHLLPLAGEGRKANIFHTLIFLILSAFSAFPTHAAENKIPPLSEADKKQLTFFFQELLDLQTLADAYYCRDNYSEFGGWIEDYWNDLATVHFTQELWDIYNTNLSLERKKPVNEKPSEIQCNAAKAKAEKLMEQNATLVINVCSSIKVSLKEVIKFNEKFLPPEYFWASRRMRPSVNAACADQLAYGEFLGDVVYASICNTNRDCRQFPDFVEQGKMATEYLFKKTKKNETFEELEYIFSKNDPNYKQDTKGKDCQSSNVPKEASQEECINSIKNISSIIEKNKPLIERIYQQSSSSTKQITPQ